VKKPNAWHEAVIAHLRAAGGSLTIEQIWQRMETAGFKHSSKLLRSTLGGRVTELAQMKMIERVGPATYRLPKPPSSEVSP
jgi:hypothetical protein